MQKNIKIVIDLVQGAKAAAGLSLINAVGDGLSEVVTIAKDLGVQSVRLAADFEVTTNSLKVFTGSARSARAELAAIDELARNTAGLRLESAEAGYKQLRALGFQANLAKGFVKELGEEKLLSGASDEALSRIVFNFAQIASGGQKVSQELREIITQMPTMQKAFFDAFNTLDPAKIQTFFDANNEAAFQKLIDAMARGEAASGGLNDAIGKLKDEFIFAGREFGKPFLDPLTKDIKDLTSYLRENQGAAQEWGQSWSDVYRGLSNAFRESQEERSRAEQGLISGMFGQQLIEKGSGGALFGYLETQGRQQREAAEKAMKPFSGRFNAGDLSKDFTVDFSRRNLAQTDAEKELAAIALDGERKRQQQLERDKKRQLDILRESSQTATSILKDRYQTELALSDSSIRYTLDQELAFRQKQAQITANHTRSEIGRLTGYYNKLIALEGEGTENAQKLELEKNRKIYGLHQELIQNAAKTQKDIAQIEKQILEQRRAAQIEYYQDSIRAVGQNLSAQNFDLNRALDLQIGNYNDHYQKLIGVTNESFNRVLSLTNAGYAEQFKNQSLTAEQRVNLEKQAFLEIQGLTEQNRQRILEIQDRQFKEQIQQIDKYTRRASQSLLSKAGLMSSVGASLSPGGINKSFVENLGLTFFGGDYDDVFEGLQKEIKVLQSGLDKELDAKLQLRLNLGRPLNDGEEAAFKDRTAKVNEELEFTQNTLKRLQTAFPTYQIELYKTIKAYDEGALSIEDFNKAQMKLFDNEILTRTKEYETRIEGLSAKISALKDDGQNAEDLRAELKALTDEKIQFQFDQANNRISIYSQTTQGLSESLSKLKSGDAATLKKLNDVFRGEKLKDEIANYAEIYRLKYDLANSPYIDSLQVEKAYLLDLTAARGRETDAIIRQNAARLELSQKGVFSQTEADAKVLEHLNQNIKSSTDAFADFKIGLTDAAFESIDSPFKALDERISKLPSGVRELASAFTDLGRDIVKALSHKFILRLLGLDTGGAGAAGAQGGGGFFDSLKGLFNTGTAPFNPNAGGSGGGGGVLGNLGGLGQTGGFIAKLFGFGGGAAASGAAAGAAPTAAMAAAAFAPMAAAAESGGAAAGASAGAGGGSAGGLGAFLTNPWTIGIAGAALGAFGLYKLFTRGKAEKKLKAAAMSEFGINVGDKKLLKNIKQIAKAYGINVKDDATAKQAVNLEESKEMLASYAESTGQSTERINKDKMSDPDFAGNNFSSSRSGGGASSDSFMSSGFSSSGGTASFKPSSSAQPSATGFLVETLFELKQEISRLRSMSPGDVVTIGASQAKEAIYDAHQDAVTSNGRLSELSRRNLGEQIG